MRNPLHTPFAAIFQSEVLLNFKRVAPYFLMVLFAANAVLWWGWGPAVKLGWATNSDFYIARNIGGFSIILGLPIFTAVIMGDPVIRDFRLGIDPLIFSKPVGRAQYVLGKFLGNFFVLVCCQAVFPLTLLVLQAFRPSGMIVQPFRVLPYFKHFILLVVISHLILAVGYFTIGTLTRNSKIVYAAAVGFYPLYIAYGVFLGRNLPPRWRNLIDPMAFGAGPKGGGFLHSADFLNRYVVTYTADMIANRSLMIAATAACLAILSLRFSIVERVRNREAFSWIDLSEPAKNIQYSMESVASAHVIGGRPGYPARATVPKVPLPGVAKVNEGPRAKVDKLLAVTAMELRLLRFEKSLLVLLPLGVLISFLSLPFSTGASDVSAAAGFAGSSARGTLIFLLGVMVFYAGEAMHRDREVKVEPGLWSTPAPDSVFLLSKFLATVLLAVGLLLLIGLTAMLTQYLRGQLPIELRAYLLTYGVIVIPSLVFIGATSIALNVLLREKYLTYVVIIAVSSGLFYLYTQGYDHWLYNPLLVQLWDYSSLAGPNRVWILGHRAYVLGLSAMFMLLAHLAYPRRGRFIAGIE